MFGIHQRLQCFQSQQITRRLPPEQIANISRILSHFRGTVANTWVFSGGRSEKLAFAISLTTALRNSDWKTNGVTTRLTPLPLKSVIVRWRPNSKAREAAEALMDALSQSCVAVVSGGAFTDNGDFGGTIVFGAAPSSEPPDDIFGPRPLPDADVSILVGEAF